MYVNPNLLCHSILVIISISIPIDGATIITFLFDLVQSYFLIPSVREIIVVLLVFSFARLLLFLLLLRACVSIRNSLVLDFLSWSLSQLILLVHGLLDNRGELGTLERHLLLFVGLILVYNLLILL